MTAASPVALEVPPRRRAGGFLQSFQRHAGAAAVAALLAFAGPLTFFTGALSVIDSSTAVEVASLALWWTLYGLALCAALLGAGHACERLTRRFGRRAGPGLWLVGACLAAAVPNVLTAGRAQTLIAQGLVHSAGTMHLHGFTVSLVMALLFFAHLRRSLAHEAAAARLAAAQAAQREARRRIVEAKMQEVQARIDPQALFEMLEAVRRLYERDAARADQLLDELIVFLRAALPRLRITSSSLAREAELARAYVRLHALAGSLELDMTVEVAPEAMHARFPPGLLLPLLDGLVASGKGPCTLSATRSRRACRVTVTLGAAPSEGALARVRGLVFELYGREGRIEIARSAAAVELVIEVPHELS